MEERNMNTEVAVEMVETNLEEASEERGKLNIGAVAVTGVLIGGAVFGIKKAVKYIKQRKAKKDQTPAEDVTSEKGSVDQIPAEDVSEEK